MLILVESNQYRENFEAAFLFGGAFLTGIADLQQPTHLSLSLGKFSFVFDEMRHVVHLNRSCSQFLVFRMSSYPHNVYNFRFEGDVGDDPPFVAADIKANLFAREVIRGRKKR
jgi:hypothetical protein